MDDTARAQEMWAQFTAKNIETFAVWADANQRLLKEWVESGLRLYGELQATAEQAGKGIQATLTDAVARTKEIYARAA